MKRSKGKWCGFMTADRIRMVCKPCWSSLICGGQYMVRWYYRSIFDELEDLREYIESLNRQMDAINRRALLPASGESAKMMLPLPHMPFPVEVSENDDEVAVIAAMAEGTQKKTFPLT